MSALPLLRKSLENLLQEHRGLLQLADEKKQILVSGKANDLSPIIAKESFIINKIRKLETERQDYTLAFLQSKRLNENLSLKETLPFIDDLTERSQITILRDELKTVLLELKNCNELNQQLIKQSLSYVHLSLDLLTENHEPSPIYGNPQNQASKKSNRSYFDSKI